MYKAKIGVLPHKAAAWVSEKHHHGQNVQMGKRTRVFEVIVSLESTVLCSHELHTGMANPCKI